MTILRPQKHRLLIKKTLRKTLLTDYSEKPPSYFLEMASLSFTEYWSSSPPAQLLRPTRIHFWGERCSVCLRTNELFVVIKQFKLYFIVPNLPSFKELWI
jgi:hypothetical protein